MVLRAVRDVAIAGDEEPGPDAKRPGTPSERRSTDPGQPADRVSGQIERTDRLAHRAGDGDRGWCSYGLSGVRAASGSFTSPPPVT